MADIIEQAVGEIIVRDSSAMGVRSATKNFQELYNVVRFNWWGIQNLGNAFSGIGGTIAAGLGAAVKASINFDQGLVQVQRTANLSKAEVEDMGNALRQLALQKPIDVGVLSKIAADAGALGINGVANIKAFTGTIADLVSTTNLTEDSAVQLARLGGVLGLQGKDWERLGSAILYAGVNSAATERDIVNMSVRLSGAAASAHLTAAEIVALAATTTSLGSSSQVGATSIQRFFTQVSKAAATGKPSLLEFAHVAGYEGPEAAKKFAAAFNQDAAQALAQFVTGLGKMQGNTLAVGKVLNDLGFNGQRGAQTLLQLAAGTRQNVNPMLDLRKSLQLTTAAYANNIELQKQAQQVYGSTANQLKLTENVIKDVAIGFGNTMLPAINAVLKPLADVIWGFDQLPGPVKTIIAYLGVFTSALFLLVGGAAVLIPRLILVKGSILEMGRVMIGLTDTVGVTVRALNLQAEAEGRVADVTAFSAARMSKADKDRAVSAYQATIASKQKQIQDQAEAQVAAILVIRQEALTEMYRAQIAAKASLAEETRLLAEANELEAKGDLDAAEAKRVDAEIAAEDAAASQRLAAARMADADAAGVLASETMALATAETEAVVAIEESTIATEGETAAMYGLGTAVDAALGPIGWVIAGISALAIGLGFLGGKHREAAHAAQDQVDADTQLTAIIKKTGQTAGDTVQDFYFQNSAFLTAARGAKVYGIEAQNLLNIILGLASETTTKSYFDDLARRYRNGDEAAGQLYNSTRHLILSQQASAMAAKLQAQHEQATGKSMDDASSAANKESDSLAKLKKAHDDINQAVLDLPGAYLAVRQAQQSVTQAQQALDDAQNAGVKHAEDIKKAEDELAQARIDQAKAQQAVTDAETTLATARVDAANRVIDAQNKLLDDTDKLADTQDKVAELEAKIAAEREGPSVRDITDATNKLADANIKLLNSQKKVGDAQYMLNYLMHEGASARDVSDAQDALAAANQDVADNTQAVGDAQDNLNKVRAGADPVQLAKDERDLAAAERDLASVQRGLADDQTALNQARADQASDKAYKEAQQALAEAQLALDAANYKVIDSTDALHKVQRESPANAVKDAQLQLESALYGLAKANVQVQKDTAIMHGEQFGAGREAQALADQLDKMGLKAAGPVRTHLQQMSAALRQSVSDIKDASAAASNYGTGPAATPTGPMPSYAPPTDLGPTGEKAGKSMGDGIIGWFKHNVKYIALGIIAALAFALGPGELGLLAVAIGVAVAWMAHEIVTFFGKYGKTIANGIGAAFHAIIQWFQDNWPLLLAILTGPFGLLIYWLHGHWGEVTGVVNTAITWLRSHWPLLLAILTGPFGLTILWLHNHWGQVTNKIAEAWNWVRSHWHELTGMLTGPFGTAINWIESKLSWLGNKLSSFRNYITGNPFGFLKTLFIAPLSGIQYLWNQLWEWLGSMSYRFDIPSPLNKIPGVPDHVGMGFGFLKHLEVHIPGLASGGIVSDPTLAMIGEGHGSEAVMPLDKLFSMFQPIDTLAMQMHATTEALHELLSMQGVSAHGGGDTYNFHEVMADPVDIVREVVWTKKTRLR